MHPVFFAQSHDGQFKVKESKEIMYNPKQYFVICFNFIIFYCKNRFLLFKLPEFHHLFC